MKRAIPFFPTLVLLASLLLPPATLPPVAYSLEGTTEAAAPLPAGEPRPPSPTALGGIEGILYEPDGISPVVGGWVDIYDAGGTTWPGTWTDNTGYYALPDLPPGDYILTAYPPDSSPYAASVPVAVHVWSGQWSTQDLYLTVVRISGWVQDCATAAPIGGATVVAHDDDWTVAFADTTDDNTGAFKIGGVEIGITYTLEAFPPPDSPYTPPEPLVVIPTATGILLQMCLPVTNVVGIVHEPDGTPLPEARAVIYRNDFWEGIESDFRGRFAFHGLPTGTFSLQVLPPAHRPDLRSSAPISVVLPLTDTLVDVGIITLPYAIKMVQGRVLLEDVVGVTDANVLAWQLDGPGFAATGTDGNGFFALGLSGGIWEIGIDPPVGKLPFPWVYTGPPAGVAFERNLLPETATVTLSVRLADAQVVGQIVCPGGVPCAGNPPFAAIKVVAANDEIALPAELRPDYTFAISLPHGWYEGSVFVEDPAFQGPPPDAFFVAPGETLDVGPVELVARDARITGRVLDGYGGGVAGIPVVAWQPGGGNWSTDLSDGNGVYTLPVAGGDWFVQPQPKQSQPYIFQHGPKPVGVKPGSVVTGVNFVLTPVDARILGTAVDAYAGDRLWELDGWAWGARYIGPPDWLDPFSDAPLQNGGFTLKVKGGDLYWVGVEVPFYAPYVSGNAGPFPVQPEEWVNVQVPLLPKDAQATGQLMDIAHGVPAVGAWGEVWAKDSQGHHAAAGIDPTDAAYAIDLVSGTWSLRPWVDPESGYVAIPTRTVVTVTSGQVVFQDLPVWPVEGLITGTVLDPYGLPLPGALVFAEGEAPPVGYVDNQGVTDERGQFALPVPEGEYAVGVVLPHEEMEALGWLSPPITQVVAPALNPVTGLRFRFRQVDGVLAGTVTFAPGVEVTPTHPVYLWAWAESGEWTESWAHFDPSGVATYTLPVISNTLWHVGAVYEDHESSAYYESREQVVWVDPAGGFAWQDLVLEGPWPLIEPLIVSFEASEMQNLRLEDGTQIVIPPGALAVSGTVTLYIFPTKEVWPGGGRSLIGLGYEIWATDESGAEITQFNQEVLIILHYPPDEELVRQGISEEQLVPAYYSTLLGRWVLLGNYAVNREENTISFWVEHFTRFGSCLGEPSSFQTYLPLVLKSH